MLGRRQAGRKRGGEGKGTGGEGKGDDGGETSKFAYVHHHLNNTACVNNVGVGCARDVWEIIVRREAERGCLPIELELQHVCLRQ